MYLISTAPDPEAALNKWKLLFLSLDFPQIKKIFEWGGSGRTRDQFGQIPILVTY